MKTVKILAPASVANLVCGFDVLGMSLADPADEMTMSLSEEPGIRIVHEDAYGLPEAAEKNVAGAALLAMTFTPFLPIAPNILPLMPGWFFM